MIGMVATLAFAAPAAAAQYAGIVVDAKTGKVLYSEDADALRYPASLTKMMTLYLTF
jgi:D-alanyl-D-alanine carboxypeptidase